MRRQLGADWIDLDTRLNIARVGLVKPQRIEISKVQAAMKEANYKLARFDLVLPGKIIQASCTDGVNPLLQTADFVVDKTQQMFHISGRELKQSAGESDVTQYYVVEYILEGEVPPTDCPNPKVKLIRKRTSTSLPSKPVEDG